MNVLDILKDGTSYLSECGVEHPRVEADLILAYIQGIDRDQLYLRMDQEVSLEKERLFKEMIVKRGDRTPLAYILKNREFMGLSFYVDERVLIPRPETELIVEKVLEAERKVDSEKIKMLDLCTGSGAIAISCAHYCRRAEVTASDISFQALEVAKKNAADLGVKINLVQGDFLNPFKGQQYHFILSNPPYVAPDEYDSCLPEVQKEPPLALLGGRDGLDFYRLLAEQAADFLFDNGFVMIEIGWTQGEQVCSLFRNSGFVTEIHKDLAGLDRMVVAWKQKG